MADHEQNTLAQTPRATLNSDSSKPMSGFKRHDDGPLHPVLARFPDVTSPPATTTHTSRAAAAGFVDYRFDIPAPGEDTPIPATAAPHAFGRTERSDFGPRSFARRSSVLPDSSPFAFPTTTLLERLAPVIRFLALFLIFTAVGTFALNKLGERQEAKRVKPREAPAVESTIRSQQTLEPAAGEYRPAPESPTARGPLGATRKRPAADPAPAIADLPAVDDLFQPLSRPPAATSPRLAAANGGPLPKVQTIEPSAAPRDGEAAKSVAASPPAPVIAPTQAPVAAQPAAPRVADGPPVIARLPGFILAAPAQQAQHDNHQPGLH